MPSRLQVEDVRKRIEVTSHAYQDLHQSGLDIEVRFSNEYCRFWAHYIDNSEVFIGPLLQGSSGLEATVLHLKAKNDGNLLVQFYQDEFDRLWDNGVSAEQSLQARATAGEAGKQI
jgi:hypothetical protein